MSHEKLIHIPNTNRRDFYEPSREALGLMGGYSHCLKANGEAGVSTLNGLCGTHFMSYQNSTMQSYNVSPSFAVECPKWCARNGTPTESCVQACNVEFFHPVNRMPAYRNS
jgi:hypothetical protein